MAPPVDRYIAQMRLNHPDRVEEEMYDLIVGDTFRTFAGHFGLTTSLRIVYTPSRRAERLRIGGESWLIYDQYLGQTFNILNRIFFNAEGEREAIAYFHKYIAERTLEYGQAELGIEPANFYAEQKNLLRKTVDGNPLRAAFTILAEQFAVFHELSHEILNSGHDSAGFYMGIVADNIASKREFHLSRTAESVVEGFRNGSPAAYGIPGPRACTRIDAPSPDGGTDGRCCPWKAAPHPPAFRRHAGAGCWGAARSTARIPAAGAAPLRSDGGR